MSNVRDMTRGNPTKLILTFALPLMLGNLGQQLYMVVDTIIVGQGVGVNALAALGATDWINWMILWMVHGFTQGFAILVAQHFGAGNYGMVKKSIAMSAILTVVIGSALTVTGVLIAGPMLRLLNTPVDIYDGANAYLTTIFAGTLVVMAYNMTAAILRALGNGKTPLVAMVIAAVINVGLDLLFVIVFGWGIVGAAVATVIAQFISFVYCFAVIRKIDAVRPEKADWKVDRPLMGRMLKLGTPLGLQQGIIAVGGMVLQSVINGLGFLFVAGFTATNKLYGLLESTAIAFGYSMTTYTGQNLGAKKLHRVEEGMKSVLKLSVIISVAISVAMILFGRGLLGLFVSSAEANAAEVLDIAYRYLVIMSMFLLSLYLLHAYRSALQGLGNAIGPMVSGIIEFAMRVTAALAFPLLMGETGIFYAEIAAWVGAAIYLIFAYYREMRKLKHKLNMEMRQCPGTCAPVLDESV